MSHSEKERETSEGLNLSSEGRWTWVILANESPKPSRPQDIHTSYSLFLLRDGPILRGQILIIKSTYFIYIVLQEACLRKWWIIQADAQIFQ